MKESKAVNDRKRDFNKQIHAIKVIKVEQFLSENKEVGCQIDSKKDFICTCRNVSNSKRDMTYFDGLPRQIYAYKRYKSNIDVGVGSVKVLQKKRVKKIYLPETNDSGVGSEDLSVYFARKSGQRDGRSYYDQKRTSSKCIGGIVDYNISRVATEKLSPIIQTRSGTTNSSIPLLLTRNIEIGSNTVEQYTMAVTTQVDNELFRTAMDENTRIDNFKPLFDADYKTFKSCDEINDVDTIQRTDHIEIKQKSKEKMSSDSLVQHIHNLESRSQDKHSRLSLDPMENKLEREYRKIFNSKEIDLKQNEVKSRQDLKRPSVLRRRFAALRRGFVKKEDTKKNVVAVDKLSSQMSGRSRKDVSIVSDPPSLEGRSFSNTKIYSPFHFNNMPEKSIYKQNTLENKSYNKKKLRDSSQFSQLSYQDSEYQGVKGMFRLWGKKFNLEEDSFKNKTTPIPFPSSLQTMKGSKKSDQIKNNPEIEEANKKDGRKFFFFKKKTKNKSKETTQLKKSITAGRCELRDGLMIKIGGKTKPDEERKDIHMSEEILRKPWLTKYLSRPIESRNSVQIRWNNRTYNTSSSTVFELMDTIYKRAGLVLRSKSEITTSDSSSYKSKTQHVTFARKEVEAWMIEKTVQDKPKQLPVMLKNKSKDNLEVTISDQKWFIDKSQAFSHKIEVVLHSNNIVNPGKDSNSSEYLRIDIPKWFLIDSSSSEGDKNNNSSDEEVYKIVEYDTEFDSKKNKIDFETGDHKSTDIKIIVNVKDSKNFESNCKEMVIKRPPAHRDVIIQGSKVNIPGRCDVIGVGIITQRNLREIIEPILQISEDMTDEESINDEHETRKQCELAESYLQDYYRNWTPLGMNIFSSCVSDVNIKCCSENSGSSLQKTGDSSKSCPNIYDDFHASVIISSNDPCGACTPCSLVPTSGYGRPDNTFTSKLYTKSKDKDKMGPHECCKRILPKDSLEVFKRRKVYSASNKCKWACPSYGDVKPYSVPSFEDREAQDTMSDCPRLKKPCRQTETKPMKTCKKHVSMPDCETTHETLSRQSDGPLEGILSFRGAGGCDRCKIGQKCAKHAVVNTDSVCKMPNPPCKDSCEENEKAPCSETSSKSVETVCIGQPSPCVSPAPCIPSSPCKQPAPCIQPPPCKPTPICKPPPSCTPTPPCRQPAVVKKRSPTCLLIKKPSPNTKCKKCQPCPSPIDQMLPLSPSKNSRPPTPPCCRKSTPAEKSSLICPHFPPCKKTQSSQISPRNSPHNAELSTRKQCSKKTGNECSIKTCPQKKNRPIDNITQCDSCISKNVENDSSPQPSKCCNKPTCPKSSSVKIASDEKWPWPTENQISNQPSLDSVGCQPPICPSPPTKPKKCKKGCTMSPNCSKQSLPPQKTKIKENECRPDCANRPKMQKRKPPPKSKISGLFLKMKPSTKKTCSKDCLGWREKKNDNIIQTNSNKNITIRNERQTPSTKEIREAMGIEVKDIDGQTIYERRDYRRECHNRAASILGDVYKSSNVNVVSTPLTIKNAQTSDIKNRITESRSEASLSNLIEIKFKMKITQGDKTTEINIANDENNDNELQLNGKEIDQPQDVFVVKNNQDNSSEDIAPKNDVDILIIIKNYKSNVKAKEKVCTDDFSKKISKKFQTVSTGYSDVCAGQNADNVYSIHRTTIDLTSSNEKSITDIRLSGVFGNVELVQPEHVKYTASSNNAKPIELESKMGAKNTEDKCISHIGNSYIDSQDFQTQDEDSIPNLHTENQEILEVKTSNIKSSTETIEKPRCKKEKKELLRKVFEKANVIKPKNKNKMKQLRDMLKIILTSDSSNTDIAVTSNELAKDVTYASLKPNYFRDTDSMNNYYKIDSNLSVDKESAKYYPTEENNSECSVISDNSTETSEIEAKSCMCSALADRLNLCNAGERPCCCRSSRKNGETCCDLKDEILLSNHSTSGVVDLKTFYKSSQICNINLNSSKDNITENFPAVLTQYDEMTCEVAKEKIKKKNSNKGHDFKRLSTTLHISNRDETIIVKTRPKRLSADVKVTDKKGEKKLNDDKLIRNDIVLANFTQKEDILQSYETKKAVLEIYTENTIANNFVAKLPKFIYETESEIGHYENNFLNYKSVCKRNIVTSLQS